MKYYHEQTITHTCGHKHTYSLSYNFTKRAVELHRLWGQKCPECQRQAYIKSLAVKTESSKAGLPELQGTQKQVSWAIQIRLQQFRALSRQHSSDVLIPLISKHPDAKFWIDNRNQNAQDLFQRL